MPKKKDHPKKSPPAGSLAREKLEGRLVGGKFSELANYSDLFERSHDGIALVDLRDFEVLETNPAFRTIFGETSVNLEIWLTSGKDSFETVTSDGKIVELSAARVRLADYCEVFQVLARDVTKERAKQDLLERQSLTDEMTGLSNFRAFSARLALEHERAEKRKSPYCVLFFDVDHFKHFNDRNGHPAGDETLRKLATVLRRVSGRSEFVARYGGEEFVVLIAGADLEAGRAFAELARREIESEKFPHGEFQPLKKVTTSIGVAVWEVGVSADEILKRADGALYESKQAGRNRVTAYVNTRTALTYLLKKAA